ncbi:MAG: MarR family transcriptional regulator [Gammaproteobacteria bacterium]|nr:MarR family transcriptional regulator [Gammaproteobacteria bacterium]
MKLPILKRNLPLLLAQVRENVITHFRPILNHFGLTEQQWRVLRVLHERSSAEPRELCELCQILSASMPRILRKLEEIGLIERQPIEGDKRRIKILLSEQSKEMMYEIIPLIEKQYKLLKQAWGNELIEQLYKTIDDCLAIKYIQVERIKLPGK